MTKSLLLGHSNQLQDWQKQKLFRFFHSICPFSFSFSVTVRTVAVVIASNPDYFLQISGSNGNKREPKTENRKWPGQCALTSEQKTRSTVNKLERERSENSGKQTVMVKNATVLNKRQIKGERGKRVKRQKIHLFSHWICSYTWWQKTKLKFKSSSLFTFFYVYVCLTFAHTHTHTLSK